MHAATTRISEDEVDVPEGDARDASWSLHAQPPRVCTGRAQVPYAGLVWLWAGTRQTQPLPETAASARFQRHLIGLAQGWAKF